MTEQGTVVLDGQRHYFGFSIREHLEVVARNTPCTATRCSRSMSPYLIDYAYVRERDMHPTYVVDAVCPEHARQFADKWGIPMPDGVAA